MDKQIFLVIEGTDGSGKKTQSELLLKSFIELGIPCVRQSFPNYDSISSGPVKMYLNGDFGDSKCLTAKQSNSLYAVDRLCTMQQLKPHIQNGGSIIFDRYVSSSMLHQAGLIDDKDEKDEFLEYVDNFEFNILQLPRPTIIFFLDVPVDISQKLANDRVELKSGNKKDIYESDKNHLIHAYETGKYVAKKYGWEIINCVKDGKLKSIDEIHQEIFDRCKKLLGL